MLTILKGHHGMNIIGQGGKIILSMLPGLLLAIWLQLQFPAIAALPQGLAFLRFPGYLLLLLGLLLWGAAVVQLLAGFPKGKLVTSGAYSVVRNPIYASVALFILPAVSLLTLTWVYFLPALCLAAGVILFIRKEEHQLTQAFGQEYTAYLARVDRLIPFTRP
jgi:protein-S-isoprenylcysteine O-methyltransferase Ste14